MADTRMLPVGIENFEEIRRNNFYYVDKTGLIGELLDNWSKVNLFTRPRRFGKTLNMSMLQHFLEVGTDPSLFEGLAISKRNDLCQRYMGQYPVIFVSLKGVDGATFDDAFYMLKTIIRAEARRHSYLKSSDTVSAEGKELLEDLLQGNDKSITDSLRSLTEILAQHYQRSAILLIDEYDVPLDKAFENGYYSEMVRLLRTLLGQALKTNDHLQFAVLTGCLRVSKESIFTGLNNFEVNTITDVAHDEHFGFTEDEVRTMLHAYGLDDRIDIIREWYDGYHFGDADIYCPWDVIRYVKKLRTDPDAQPEAFWINTSGNTLVRRFVSQADKTTKGEIERLIAGEAITKRIRQELTYEEIDSSIDNLWSVLFTTGYLTIEGRTRQGECRLIIPNREIREVFVDQIQEWFQEAVMQELQPIKEFSLALLDGQSTEVENRLNQFLASTISILDSKARKDMKENFYHGLLLGLFRINSEWNIMSNVEAGNGFADIIIEPEDPDAGIIIEVKYASSYERLEEMCDEAMQQIRDRRYDEYLRNDGRDQILAYGIAFCKKKCHVRSAVIS